MNKTIARTILISAISVLALGALIGAAYLIRGDGKCHTITGCANIPGLRETLKAMPTYTPGPSETPLPCHWEGSFCMPGIESPKSVEPGHLRPVGPGYPYDLHA